jgi:hypothetical protein
MPRRSSIVRVSVIGDASQLNQAFDQASKQAEAFGQKMQRTGQSLTRNVTLPLVAAFGLAFKASEEQAKAEAKLNAVLKATGGIAGITAGHVKSLASELQQVTTFGDEVTISAANVLLTFKNLRNEVGEGNDVFDRTTRAMLDMSVALDQDLKSSAVQLGKALNDPIQGVSALTRVGVTFTEQQKKQIKTLQESGDLLGAQKIILAELESQFQGTAAAVAETAGGQMKQALNALGDAGEQVGAAIAPVLIQVADGVKAVADGFQRLSPETQDVIVKFGLFAAAAGPLLVILGKLAAAYTAIRTAALGAAAAQAASAGAGGAAGAGAAAAAGGKALAGGAAVGLAAPTAGLAALFIGAKVASDKWGDGLVELDRHMDNTRRGMDDFRQSADDFKDAQRDATDGVDEATEVFGRYRNTVEQSIFMTKLQTQEQEELNRVFSRFAPPGVIPAPDTTEFHRRIAKASETIRNFAREQLALTDPVLARALAEQRAAQAQERLVEVSKDKEATDRDREAAAIDVLVAESELQALTKDLADTISGPVVDSLNAMIERTGLQHDLFRFLIDDVREYDEALRKLGLFLTSDGRLIPIRDVDRELVRFGRATVE